MDFAERGCRIRYSHEEFLEVLRIEQIDVQLLEPYSGSIQPIAVRCGKCGHEWTTTPHTLVYSRGCEQCRSERLAAVANGNPVMSHDEFVAKVFEANRDILIFGKFSDIDSFIMCGCARCGRRWKGNPRRLLAGIGCRCPSYRTNSESNRLESVSGFPIESFFKGDEEWADEFYRTCFGHITPDEMDELFQQLLG